MTKISIVTPTHNEEQNIKILCEDIKKEFEKIDLEYEHIVIDNASTDNTIKILEEICSKDKKVKVIINSKNYGHIRSPFYGLLQTNSDATILMSSDFQDPIDLIPKYIEEWKNGKKIVLGQKTSSEENRIKYSLRNIFYNVLNKISDFKLPNNTTGAGIFDKSVIEKLKKINDPYPYFRGLIAELGEDITTIEFKQPLRKFGTTKNNIFTLYDIGMLGIVKHSRKPLRFMTLLGFVASIVSLLVGLIYLFYKLIFWDSFSMGIAPLIIGMFFFGSFQILLLGLVGEYVGIILIHQRKMPHVVEKEKINFN